MKGVWGGGQRRGYTIVWNSLLEYIIGNGREWIVSNRMGWDERKRKVGEGDLKGMGGKGWDRMGWNGKGMRGKGWDGMDGKGLDRMGLHE